jgi:hypothetical protein
MQPVVSMLRKRGPPVTFDDHHFEIKINPSVCIVVREPKSFGSRPELQDGVWQDPLGMHSGFGQSIESGDMERPKNVAVPSPCNGVLETCKAASIRFHERGSGK